jgi:FlaA1/EpsC-like NDP-sugar epimerase
VVLADVSDGVRMSGLFSEHRPDIVFHAAAYKHVPMVERDPGEGLKNIVACTRLLADLARQHGVDSFVMISTDKAVNPTSVMGCCKRVGELYVQAMAAGSKTRFVTVRFGNVLDSAGSVIPIFRQQIAAGGPITVTHPDMQRYFMTIPEASQLVIQAGMMGKGGEIFVLDMGEPSRIVDLAHDMVRLSGLRVGEDIELSFTGLRPGEKLFEELVVTGEEYRATPHPKIRVVQGQPASPAEIKRQLETLVQLADGPAAPILDQLERIVPTYRPYREAEPAARRAA